MPAALLGAEQQQHDVVRAGAPSMGNGPKAKTAGGGGLERGSRQPSIRSGIGRCRLPEHGTVTREGEPHLGPVWDCGTRLLVTTYYDDPGGAKKQMMALVVGSSHR
jgi:hypothetical protein